MASRILKGLAVAAGTGLAMGFTSGRVRVRTAPRRPVVSQPESPIHDAEDEFLNIEPLLDRLESLEERVEAMEQRPAPAPTPENAPYKYAEAIADLELRVEENTRELALLRETVSAAERRMAEAAQVREELPALIERHVAVRIEDLRSRFAAEIEQAQQRTLETFERAIDEKIAARIGAIERALADQAGSIEALSLKTAETDGNLQRLVAAIEKLCERAQLVPQVQEPARCETELPFESQLSDAMNREPVAPVFRTEEPAEVPAPAFLAAEAAPKKSRFLFRSLIVAAFGFIGSRFLA